MRQLLAILAALLLAGCTPEPRPPKVQSPETLALAHRVASLIPGSRVILVQDTGSMEPALDGSMAVVIAPGSYAVGDIVVFKHGQGLIIHRVREVSQGRLWTKGDANGQRDGFWVQPEEVQGRVVATVKVR